MVIFIKLISKFNNMKIETKIKKVLDKVRPSLQADGGDIEFVSWDEKKGIVQVRFQGMCVGCPMAGITLKEGVAKELMKDIPEIKDVVSV